MPSLSGRVGHVRVLCLQPLAYNVDGINNCFAENTRKRAAEHIMGGFVTGRQDMIIAQLLECGSHAIIARKEQAHVRHDLNKCGPHPEHRIRVCLRGYKCGIACARLV